MKFWKLRLWFYLLFDIILQAAKVSSQKTLPSAWVPNKCTGPSTFGGNLMIVKWHSISREFFSMRPQTVSCHVPSNYVPLMCTIQTSIFKIRSRILREWEVSISYFTNLNIPSSPCLGHLWFLKVPIPPLPQLIEPTHAQITQPHEILNIISGTIGAISEWFDLSNCQPLTKSRTFPSSQSFSNPSPYK